MAENVGGIVWTAEMRTEQLLQAESQVNRSLSNTEKAYKKTGKAADATGTKMTKSAKAVNQATKGMSRNFGMAGVQVQQFVGQIQGGQSALLALSQQGADLGIVLGAAGLGSAIGIAATALSFLLNSSGSAESALDDLAEASERLDTAFDDASNGSLTLSKEIENLAKKSKGLAKLRISEGLQDADESMAKSASGIKTTIGDIDSGFVQLGMNMKSIGWADLVDEIDAINPSMDTLYNGIETTSSRSKSLESNIQGLADKFGISRQLAVQFAMAMGSVEKEASPVNIATLSNVLQDINEQTGGTSKEFTKISRSLTPFISATTDSVDKSNALRLALEDLEKVLPSNKDKTDNLTAATDSITASLQRQLITMRDGEQAGLRYAIAQQLQLKAGEQLPPEIEKIVAAIEKETDAKNAKLAADKAELQIARDIAKAKADAKKESDARTGQISSLEQEILLAEKKRDLTSEEYELKLAIMALGEGATDAEVEKMTTLIGQLQQARFESELLGQSLEKSFKDIGMSAMDDFSQATASAIVEQDSLGDAIKGVARSIISDMLAALIRYAIGSIAQAAGITAAWTPAAAAVSLGTGGANAAAATAAIGAFSGALGSALGPGRLNGGVVNPGTIYPVTEDGRPELLVSGGKQYLLPGSRSAVISNKDMSQNNSGNTSLVNNFTFNGDVDQQQARNMLFDNEDVIYNIYEQAKAKRGIQ